MDIMDVFIDDLIFHAIRRRIANPADMVETVTVNDTHGRPAKLRVPAHADVAILSELASFAMCQLPHYPKPEALPKVRIFSTKAALQEHVPNATAAFMHGTREIWAAEEVLSANSLYGNSTILHEFVHYLQAIRDNWEVRKMFGSVEHILAIELEAYNVQWEYLKANGFEFEADPMARFTATMPANKADIPELIRRYYTRYAVQMAADTQAHWKEGQ